MMKKQSVKIFSNTEELSNAAAEYILKKINSMNSGGSFPIAISGGSTPKKIFRHIAQNFKDQFNWDLIKFFFVDERCVPPDDNDSNFKMANESLFEPAKINSKNIFRIKGEVNPAEEAFRYSEILKNSIPLINRIPQFELILLGLGEDGHTASIFPNQIDIFHSKNFCEIAVHPENGQQRITLTGEVINNAKQIVFFVTGSNKSKIVYELLTEERVDPIYPASLVMPLQGKLVWMLDKEAASLLKEDRRK